jgi:hypothetical protein
LVSMINFWMSLVVISMIVVFKGLFIVSTVQRYDN